MKVRLVLTCFDRNLLAFAVRFLSKHQPSFSFKGQATSQTPAKWSNLANSPISNSPKLLDKNTRLIYTGLTSTCRVVAKILPLLCLVFFSLRLKPCTVASFAFLSSGFGEFEMELLYTGYFNNNCLKALRSTYCRYSNKTSHLGCWMTAVDSSELDDSTLSWLMLSIKLFCQNKNGTYCD